MWIFLLEILGVVLALAGWFGLHSLPMLIIGAVIVIAFDLLMSSSGGQIKSFGLSAVLLIVGAIVGGLTGWGIVQTALIFFAVYSAIVVVFKLILLVLASADDEVK